MSAAEKTTDHQTIRRWAEARGGKPSRVIGTGDRTDDDPGILRIDFPGYEGQDSLEPIDWDEFFEKFEEKKLAFLYQDKTDDGQTSFFNKLVSRKSAA